jgi:hypothetical protein
MLVLDAFSGCCFGKEADGQAHDDRLRASSFLQDDKRKQLSLWNLCQLRTASCTLLSLYPPVQDSMKVDDRCFTFMY